MAANDESISSEAGEPDWDLRELYMKYYGTAFDHARMMLPKPSDERLVGDVAREVVMRLLQLNTMERDQISLPLIRRIARSVVNDHTRRSFLQERSMTDAVAHPLGAEVEGLKLLIEVPDDMDDEQVAQLISEGVARLDAAYRALGGSGLTITQPVEVQVAQNVGVPQ